MKKTEIDKYIDNRAVMPLISWDMFTQLSSDRLNLDAEKSLEIADLNRFASIYNWKNNIKSILVNNKYEALVLTDASKNILWVNNGFTKMTGYPKSYAKNKQPVFLQGEASQEKRMIIRKKLAKELPFKEIIINYKKDGTPYECELHIFPLKSEKTTHYLALERAV